MKFGTIVGFITLKNSAIGGTICAKTIDINIQMLSTTVEEAIPKCVKGTGTTRIGIIGSTNY
jgi:hypothetical protein